MIYLDSAANTKVDEDVLNSFIEVTKNLYGNPNSLHKDGKDAKKIIDDASSYIASIFNTVPENVIYTSGASESNNLVIKGVALENKNLGKHIIISEIEHSSIIAPANYLGSLGFEVTVLKIKETGEIDLDELESFMREDTVLVSITAVDSELGTIQPIEKIARIVKKYPNCLFHTDATQAIGKADIDYSFVDFITLSPHKFNGLNGSGLLINRKARKLVPLIHGGASTTIYRSGTPVPALAKSAEVALRKVLENKDSRIKIIKEHEEYLLEELSKLPGVHLNTPSNKIHSTINFSVNNGEVIVNKLYDLGIAVSRQSACQLGKGISRSVYALTRDKNIASNTIRLSFSHLNKRAELEKFISVLKELLSENN